VLIHGESCCEPVPTLLDLPRPKAPKEIPTIRYSMVSHPRFDGDLLHVWLRQALRQIFHPHASEVKQ
jgi:LysR family transcriptional regulator, nod-box dependent transcriptional activator